MAFGSLVDDQGECFIVVVIFSSTDRIRDEIVCAVWKKAIDVIALHCNRYGILLDAIARPLVCLFWPLQFQFDRAFNTVPINQVHLELECFLLNFPVRWVFCFHSDS